MAAGGLKYIEESLPRHLKSLNHTIRTLNLAKDMVRSIKAHGLSLKIGIHRGSCMMGVIGYHKPQFSLIGDTVNTTSRHCTTGTQGHIMVSQEAWAHMSIGSVKTNGYNSSEVQTEMKGKGMTPVYHVFPITGLFKKKLFSALDKQKRSNTLVTPMENKNFRTIEKMLDKSYHNLGIVDGKKSFAKMMFQLKPLAFQVKKDRFVEPPQNKNGVSGVIKNQPLRAFSQVVANISPSMQENQNLIEMEVIPNNNDNFLNPNEQNPNQVNSRIRLGSSQPALVSAVSEVNIEESDEESEEEGEEAMLKPNKFLRFSNNQWRLYDKYKGILKQHNTGYLRTYLILILSYYIIQIILHYMTKEGYIFEHDALLTACDSTAEQENTRYYVSYAIVWFSIAMLLVSVFLSNLLFSNAGKIFFIIEFCLLTLGC